MYKKLYTSWYIDSTYILNGSAMQPAAVCLLQHSPATEGTKRNARRVNATHCRRRGLHSVFLQFTLSRTTRTRTTGALICSPTRFLGFRYYYYFIFFFRRARSTRPTTTCHRRARPAAAVGSIVRPLCGARSSAHRIAAVDKNNNIIYV